MALGLLRNVNQPDSRKFCRYSKKRCEDASHSKALCAKSMTGPVLFRDSFGSAHASPRRSSLSQNLHSLRCGGRLHAMLRRDLTGASAIQKIMADLRAL